MSDDSLTYTVGEAAKLLGVSLPTAYKAVKCGEIPTIKIGRLRLVSKSVLLKMLGDDIHRHDLKKAVARHSVGYEGLLSEILGIQKDAIKLKSIEAIIEEKVRNRVDKELSVRAKSEAKINLAESFGCNIPISELNLSVRVDNCLIRAGLNTVMDVQQKGERGLMKLRNFGAGCLAEVRQAMLARGITLSDPVDLKANVPSSGFKCEICGMRISFKGKHLIESHPEYAVKEGRHFYKDDEATKQFGRLIGSDVKVYVCATCGKEIGCPSKVIEHYNIEHPALVKKVPKNGDYLA